MKKINLGLILTALVVLSSQISFGASPPSLDSAKVGYVDFSRALNEVSDGKRAKQRLKDAFQEKQQQLDRLQSELTKLKDPIERERMLLSPEALEQKEGLYRQKFSELQVKLESYKKDITIKEGELTQEILGKLRAIVKDIGNSEGYTLILEKSQDVVLFAPEGGDLTDRVISAYDGKRGGAAVEKPVDIKKKAVPKKEVKVIKKKKGK